VLAAGPPGHTRSARIPPANQTNYIIPLILARRGRGLAQLRCRNDLTKTAAFHAKQWCCFRPKRLLRQPGGFEGFVVIPEVLGLADLAVTNGEDGRQFHIRLGSLPLGVPDPPEDNSI